MESRSIRSQPDFNAASCGAIFCAETFAPVAKLASIRTLLALAARYDWEVEQMDVKSAYLNGTLNEVIYMCQPPGSAAPGQEHLVCHLNKTISSAKLHISYIVRENKGMCSDYAALA
ncbi:hypothetical protein ONZ51_g11140 [Trametes cubensis]|uniref:Reverse transcriptase Ty1/copia-type domain-containing protein n=1 Tax=Trametes cubensis TaxID=1111947 RepID=A0AAD7TJT2_9APHY|nr:hypothetical protein ONZ51_g11140 [Trametes cubensis]